jgi:hypothetical protein
MPVKRLARWMQKCCKYIPAVYCTGSSPPAFNLYCLQAAIAFTKPSLLKSPLATRKKRFDTWIFYYFSNTVLYWFYPTNYSLHTFIQYAVLQGMKVFC